MSDGTPIIVKKKKVQAAGHHGGSWKVAYADFVTAMMAFFMVMWIMGMSAETRSMVAGYFNDPLGFVKNPPKSRSPFAIKGSPNPKPGTSSGPSEDQVADEQLQLKKVESEFRQALAAANIDIKELSKHIEVTLNDEGLRIEFQESAGAVFFETGSPVIRPVARELVGKVGPILSKSARPIIIEGHTDAQPYPGTAYTNWELSTERALSMRRALTASSVPIKQFVSVNGYAETRLKNPGDPLHFSNRRVTVLLPFKRTIKAPEDLPSDQLRSAIQGVFRKDLRMPSSAGTSEPPEASQDAPAEGQG